MFGVVRTDGKIIPNTQIQDLMGCSKPAKPARQKMEDFVHSEPGENSAVPKSHITHCVKPFGGFAPIAEWSKYHNYPF